MTLAPPAPTHTAGLTHLWHRQVVYIDGSHAAKDVIADAVLAWALLRPGGVLIFDGER